MTEWRGRPAGVRIAYHDVPDSVRLWVERSLGSAVVDAVPRVGGMSPAAAVSVRTADGRRAFVKAVGSDINPDTISHFRHEARVLAALAPVPYRASLLDAYDDGEWVAIMLEDIDGAHPDLDDSAVRDSVLAVVREQTRELAGMRDPSARQSIGELASTVWLPALAEPSAASRTALPSWYESRLDELHALTADGIGLFVEDTFCNFDVRHDNLLIRSDTAQPVIVDWGQSRIGPRWTDAMVFGLDWADEPVFDEMVATLDLDEHEEHAITAFLTGFGGRLAMVAIEPAPPGLPRLPAFRRDVAARCLAGAHRRLGL
jgi:Phosphotransferase enzyme family